MDYMSTRDNTLRLSAHEAIIRGISDDGGLFVPCETPILMDLENMTGASYNECAKRVLPLFLTDFTPTELSACCHSAYGSNKFGSNDVAPLHKMDDRHTVLELWHGPTCAFKDMALQILPRFLSKSMAKENCSEDIMILVATSGDTGKAALEGFKNVSGTRILVFYPSEGVSNMQKLQMMTQEGSNVRVCGIKGNFDDAQNAVKRIFNSPKMTAQAKEHGYRFSSANSINWGRLVPQIVYYVYAYVQMLERGDARPSTGINVCVPTGNFGNILAAFYAKEMGVPINKLICASNKNDVLTEFLTTGVYNRNRDFYTTISPSMDILISSNLERLIFHLSDRDSEYTKRLYKQLARTGEFKVEGKVLSRIKSTFECGACDDHTTMRTISKVYEHYGYVFDPHSAVAENVYFNYISKTGDYRPTIIASTASPYKFPESVLKALGEYEDGLTGFELLEKLSKVTNTEIPKSLSNLKDKKIRFDRVIKASEMDKEVIAAMQ